MSADGSDAPSAKTALRRQQRKALRALTAPQRQQASDHLVARLRRTAPPTGPVAAYMARWDEPDLLPWLRELADGARLVLPRCEGAHLVLHQVRDLSRDLQTGAFGLSEPLATCPTVAAHQLALICVPGLAFDPDGHRLGRGKGFYDRLLAMVSPTTLRWGVGLPPTLVPQVPVDPHDQPLDDLLVAPSLPESP